MTDVTTENEVKMAKLVTIGICSVIICIILAITIVTMYGDVYQAENMAAETEQITARFQLSIEQNNAIIKLIDDGQNPIAARCAIIGFDGTDLCGMFMPRPTERLK